MGNDLGDRCINGRLAGNVHLHRVSLRPKLGGRRLSSFQIDVGDSDRSAFTDIGLGKRASNTARGTSDQSAFTFETFH
ncbi:hypothetical protein D3C78_1509670 [compost metagenome]